VSALAELLGALGFHRADGRLYAAALLAGPSRPRQLIAFAGMHRPTAYRALGRLRRSGLVIGAKRRSPDLTALPLPVWIDRNVNRLRDDAEAYRFLRDGLAGFLAQASAPRSGLADGNPLLAPRPTELVGSEGLRWAVGPDVRSALIEAVHFARNDLWASPHFSALSARERAVLGEELTEASGRGVRVRLLTPFGTGYRQWHAHLPAAARTGAALWETRFVSPAPGHVYLADGTLGLRFLAIHGDVPRADRRIVLLSTRPDFVRLEALHFLNAWEGAAGPPAAPMAPAAPLPPAKGRNRVSLAARTP
jgi:hypothetical protein